MTSYEVKFEQDDWGDCVTVEALCRYSAVLDAAEIFWREHDGWEWMRDGAEFDVRADGEIESARMHVTVDFEPVFYASDTQ